MIALDHLAVAGETLEEARSAVESALGVPLQPGGAHDVFYTHNMLLGLEDGLYLEAIAINPDAPVPQRARWFDLDRFTGAPRLTNWICRADDLDAALNKSPAGMGDPVQLQRGDLRWRMAVPEDGILPFDGIAPALIQWQTSQHPARLLSTTGVRLKRLTIRHPEADALRNAMERVFSDDRVAYEQGPRALHAAFQTARGARELTG